jgi:hypothetical protein
MFVGMVLNSTNAAEIRLMMSNFIRDLHQNKGMTYAAIGEVFGCTATMICFTANNPTHLHRTGKNTRSISIYRFADGVKALGYEMTVTIKRVQDEDSD